MSSKRQSKVWDVLVKHRIIPSHFGGEDETFRTVVQYQMLVDLESCLTESRCNPRYKAIAREEILERKLLGTKRLRLPK